ncbi:MAG: hypothetical protein ACK4UN_13055, partial [Limisphaerales bacterium]
PDPLPFEKGRGESAFGHSRLKRVRTVERSRHANDTDEIPVPHQSTERPISLALSKGEGRGEGFP